MTFQKTKERRRQFGSKTFVETSRVRVTHSCCLDLFFRCEWKEGLKSYLFWLRNNHGTHNIGWQQKCRYACLCLRFFATTRIITMSTPHSCCCPHHELSNDIRITSVVTPITKQERQRTMVSFTRHSRQKIFWASRYDVKICSLPCHRLPERKRIFAQRQSSQEFPGSRSWWVKFVSPSLVPVRDFIKYSKNLSKTKELSEYPECKKYLGKKQGSGSYSDNRKGKPKNIARTKSASEFCNCE